MNGLAVAGVEFHRVPMQATRKLTRTTKLRCAQSFAVSTQGDAVTLRIDGVAVFSGGKSLLGILGAFAVPRAMDEGLAIAAAGGGRLAHDSMERSAAVLGLVSAGILEPDDGLPLARVASTHGGFAAAPIHIAMLNDRARTQSYLDALRSQVRPGDIVVDVGTGTGILAAAAAQCGAARVYAIEATGIASVAKALFEANGLSEKVTLVEGRSSAVDLPEHADLLVSELIGNDPLGEKALAYMRDAVSRFAKPEARLVPRSVRVVAQPVHVPSSELARYLFTNEVTSQWTEQYGIDFSPLATAHRARPHAVACKPDIVGRWLALGDAVELSNIDFKDNLEVVVDVTRGGRVTRAGVLNAVVISFDLTLAEGHCITSRPGAASPECHWRCPVWLLTEPFEVEPGHGFEVYYRHTPSASTVDCRRR